MNNATNLVIFDPMYETDEGLEYINPADTKTIQEQIEAGRFRLAFHFQSVDCAAIHAVTKKNKWNIDWSVYNYLLKSPYDKRTLFKLLLLGDFDIGVSRIGSYHIVREIKPYDDDINGEIRMHYSLPRSVTENVAWRSINWDFFEEFVNKE